MMGIFFGRKFIPRETLEKYQFDWIFFFFFTVWVIPLKRFTAGVDPPRKCRWCRRFSGWIRNFPRRRVIKKGFLGSLGNDAPSLGCFWRRGELQCGRFNFCGQFNTGIYFGLQRAEGFPNGASNIELNC